MNPTIRTATRALTLGLAFLAGAAGLVAAPENRGASTGVDSYMEFDSAFLAANPGATITTLRSVADDSNFNVAQMVGIPDGMGGFDNGDGTFTLLMNQELGATAGIVRAHGQKGSFVSKWIINKSDLTVLSIGDLTTSVAFWNATNSSYNAAGPSTRGWGRFCSATVPPVSALYNAATGKGTKSRVIMNGEEDGTNDHAWLHVASGPFAGVSYELRHLGRASYENAGACPFPQDKTIVISQDDGSTNAVTVYIGDKRSTGVEAEKAGLVGGKNYALQVRDGSNAIIVSESDTLSSSPVSGAKSVSSNFTLVELTNSDTTEANIMPNSNGDGGKTVVATAAQNILVGNGLATTTPGTPGAPGTTGPNNSPITPTGYTKFVRPEDGAWDPRPVFKNDFYFVTTAGKTTRSRLYRLRFTDIANPELGGTITCLLDGTEGQVMFDNLTVGADGSVLIQEDPGNFNGYAKIWKYDPATGNSTTVMLAKSTLFSNATTQGSFAFNNDEETSGIFDASDILGPGRYIYNMQVHTNTSGANAVETAQHGQLAVLYIPSKSVVTRGAASYNRAKTVVTQTFTVKNTSSGALTGPVKLGFVGLPAGTTVVSQTGTDTVAGQANTPYVTVSASDIASEASASITVRFNVPASGSVSCDAVVF